MGEACVIAVPEAEYHRGSEGQAHGTARRAAGRKGRAANAVANTLFWRYKRAPEKK
jgi:hypothetical protein